MRPSMSLSKLPCQSLFCAAPRLHPLRHHSIVPNHQSLSRSHSLNLIHLLSAGIDHFVSHPLFTQTDIPITTSSGIHGPTISEWALMSALVLSKSYNKMHELQKEHKWGKARQDFPEPTDWVGMRVGIAGYGSIGRQSRSLALLPYDQSHTNSLI